MLLSKLRNKIIGEVTTSKDIPQLDIDDIISFQDCAIKLISEQSIKVIALNNNRILILGGYFDATFL